ncbi:hypothetical protein [Gordonia sp. (in: high G+C Gram-positive bacteria)]|uniref:hypothetical protein n=1 Tax=Gordonia sp. (in: high G+C Gram-positive bacteria) TaxID=84139 RepID=UPI0016972590|nr:hypothetical protein [Gordonia sp. (in: high G+C Gram-positive bacteria)]NLG47330.1 hypothetical protein [Gordonia sp. (in: high G+C Gram-positive bacteria)]
MQLMYVVDLDVEGDGAFERVVAHLARWLGRPEARLDPADLSTSGARALAPARTPHGHFSRQGDWDVAEAADHRALKFVVSQAVGTDVEVTTRITVTEIDGAVHFRVGIGREATRQNLVPVDATDIYQPGILRLLDEDVRLTLRARGQLVNRRYIPVKTVAEAHAVAAILSGEERLPLALIHVRSKVTWELAGELSKKLLGLVRTVTVNFETARVIAGTYSDARVPFGGFAIVWPGLGAPSFTMSAERLTELGADSVRQYLMHRLGALAALGNGEDTAWRRVRGAVDSARMVELAAQVASAREGGDKEGEIAALKEQVDALQIVNAEFEDVLEGMMQEAEASRDLLRTLESARDQAREEAQMWQDSYKDLSAGKSRETAVPMDIWSAIPELVPRTDPEATFLAIADAASQRIVFTDRARKSWSGIDYPEPDDMTAQLVALARAAADLYGGDVGSIPHLDAWLKEHHGLSVALTDQTITKFKKKEMRWLNNFEFEGETLNATPHVKLRDAVKFNECGRIHFALETKKDRLVVQHVGTKTYK